MIILLACICVCHFLGSPESRWLARSFHGRCRRVSRGSSLIDAFWVEELLEGLLVGWVGVGGMLRMMRGLELDEIQVLEVGMALK